MSDRTTAVDSDVEFDASAKLRPLTGGLGLVFTVIAVATALAHIYVNSFDPVSELMRNSLHFGVFAFMCALIYPTVTGLKTERGRRLMLAIDVALGLVVLAAVVYILAREREVSNQSFTSVWDYVACTVLVIAAMEFARRAASVIIVMLIAIALGYILWFGQFIPGSMGFPGLSYEIVLMRAVYGEEGLFGTIASISSTFVFMFILFGAFLVKSGAGDFIINIARAIAGKLTGGAGFVAVMSSALTGTISGSAVANTVSTGVITIPLMKKSGFPPRFAAGVEATASTGGQLMPPIMGAGAFVMANYTEIPYFDIVAVALLPALLYFAGIAFNVRIVAKREKLQPQDQDAPSAWQVLKTGGVAFLLPIVVLIGLLMMDFTPTYAAGFAILSVIVASWLTPNRMGPKEIVEALVLGCQNMVMTAILLVAVGLIVMVMASTGVGNTISLMITEWAGGNLIWAIVLIAVASLVLGMGLPVTAAYIVLATLAAPALRDLILQGEILTAFMETGVPASILPVFMLFTPDVLVGFAANAGLSVDPAMAEDLVAAVTAGAALTAEQARLLVALLDIPEVQAMAGRYREEMLPAGMLVTALLSAHMIIFWLSQDSNVTPPVCLTAFAAAAIAKTKPMATGFVAWKVAKTLYIVPLLFAYTPFLSGDPLVALEIFVFALLGIYALVAALEGHAEAPVPMWLRPVLAAIGLALLWPNSIIVHVIGALALIGFMVINVRMARAAAQPAPTEA